MERNLSGFDVPDYGLRMRSAFEKSAGVLVVNPATAEMVRSYAPRVDVIPSGFDATRFEVAPSRRPGESKKVLFAGLTNELMKGFHVLREAAARLWKTRQDFRIVATGDPPDQDREPFIEYIGWQSQSDLPRVMKTADMLVFPTIAQEALGRTAVEAMGAGIPVVASRLGGLSWVVDDEETGLLVQHGDSRELAAAIARLFDDPQLSAEMGRRGREKFLSSFTWETILPQYRRLFHEVTNTSASLPLEPGVLA